MGWMNVVITAAIFLIPSFALSYFLPLFALSLSLSKEPHLKTLYVCEYYACKKKKEREKMELSEDIDFKVKRAISECMYAHTVQKAGAIHT